MGKFYVSYEPVFRDKLPAKLPGGTLSDMCHTVSHVQCLSVFKSKYVTVDFHWNELQGESYLARQNRSSLWANEKEVEDDVREEEDENWNAQKTKNQLVKLKQEI